MSQHNFTFDARLAAAEASYQEQRKALALPPMTEAQDLRLQKAVTFSAYRLLRYLFNGHQGERTDRIAAAIAISNVPDVASKNRERMALVGLGLRCDEVPVINQHGSRAMIGRWWLSINDPDKWHGTAENDSVEVAQ